MPKSSPGSVQSYVEAIEELTREKQALQTDISELYNSAKDAGLDVSLIREMLKLRKIDADALTEREALRSTYMEQLNLFAAPVDRAVKKFVDSVRIETGDKSVTVA